MTMSPSRLPPFVLLALLLSAGAVAAHSPLFVDGNDTPDTAMRIDDPARSWAIYSHLRRGEVLYFTFDAEEGDRLLLGLIIPVKDGDAGFLPRMVLMAPGISEEGALPSRVEVPSGYGYKVLGSSLPEEATYEGFSPSSFYDLGGIDSPAPVGGRYYVAVYATGAQEGNFALVVGYAEMFTAQELVLIPFRLYSIYLWEGQRPYEILAPMTVTILAGLLVIFHLRRRMPEGADLQSSTLLLSGLLVMGTAASTMVQTIISVRGSHLGPGLIVSVSLFTIAGVLGILLLRRGWKGGARTPGERAGTAVIGLVAIFVWAGYLLGPALAILAAALPERVARWSRVQKMPR